MYILWRLPMPLGAQILTCFNISFQCAILRTRRENYDQAVRALYHEKLFLRLSSKTCKPYSWVEHGGISAMFSNQRTSNA